MAAVPTAYRTVAADVTAIRWTGGDTTPLTDLCGPDGWTRADAQDMHDHDDEAVIVHSVALDVWLPVRVGDWVVRDATGDIRPCRPDRFHTQHHLAAAGRRRTRTGW